MDKCNFSISQLEDDDITLVSRADTEREIAKIEEKIAERFGISSNVRATIMDMCRKGKMVEDELVADWHDAYSSLHDWDIHPMII